MPFHLLVALTSKDEGLFGMVPASGVVQDSDMKGDALSASLTENDDLSGDSSYGEESIGILAAHYSCTFNLANGRLEAGNVGLYFDGFFFFMQQTFYIKWVDVLQVQKGDVGQIKLLDKKGNVFVFSKLLHSDRVWPTLVSLHNSALTDAKTNSRSLVSPVRPTLRRMSSDPLPEKLGEAPDAGALSKTVHMNNLRAATSTRQSMMKSSVGMTSLRDIREGSKQDLGMDLEKEWNEVVSGGAASYSEKAIQNYELGCSMDTFFEMFLANDCHHSMARFMKEVIGDSDVVASAWKPGPDSTRTRTLEYSHPVNAPLAPPMARARKEQRFRRFGTRGMVLETDTHVDDVPMADCFYVTDRILIEPTASKAKVLVSIEFDIRFIKSTMFRAIIGGTSRSEFLSMFESLLEMMAEALGAPSESNASKISEKAKVKPKANVESTTVRVSTARLTQILLGCLVILIVTMVRLQYSILAEMRGMNARLIGLETKPPVTVPGDCRAASSSPSHIVKEVAE